METTEFEWIDFKVPNISWFIINPKDSSYKEKLVYCFDYNNSEHIKVAIKWYITVGNLIIKPIWQFFTKKYSIIQSYWWDNRTITYNLKSLEEVKLYKKWLEKLMWLKDKKINQIIPFKEWKELCQKK